MIGENEVATISKVNESAKQRRLSRRARLARRISHALARRVVTIYLYDSGIKLMSIKGNVVEKCTALPLEPGLINNGVITDPKRVGLKLREAFDGSGVKRKNVIVGLSGLHSLSRIITLPYLPPHLRAEAIKREAERELPVPLNNIYLSWQAVSVTRQEMKIFLAAYARNVIDTLVEALRQAGIKPYVMDTAPIALTRVVDRPTTTILDVRPGELDIVVMVNGVPELIRSLPIPKDKPLSEKLPIVKEELERTIRFYYTDKPLLHAQIFGSGELVDEPDLHRYLSSRLGYTMAVPSLPLESPDQSELNYYMVNIGLALRQIALDHRPLPSVININALPEVYREAKRPSSRFLLTGSAIAAAAVIGYLGFLWQGATAATGELESWLARTNQAITVNQAQQILQNKEIADLGKQITDSKQVHSTFTTIQSSLTAQQAVVKEDLRAAFAAIPSNVVLLNIVHSGDIVLEARAPGMEGLFACMRNLENTGRFSEVVVGNLRDNGAAGIIFKLLVK